MPTTTFDPRVSRLTRLVALSAMALSTACARVPSPLTPLVSGSVGMPHRGVLTDGAELAKSGDGFALLRDNDRRFGLPRFVHAIERAAANVALARPGGTLVIGDLSAQAGGSIMPHFSHRNGRDADLVFFAMTLDGVPTPSPGFIHYGADGLAWDDAEHRYLRFDVEREWILVKSLLEDDEARVQWMFISRTAEAMLLEWASARDEPAETLAHARDVMAQPQPGGEHDDHIHIRTACSLDDMVHGCEPNGPTRPWLAIPTASRLETAVVDELVAALLQPIDAAGMPAPLPSTVPASIPIALR